MCITKKAPKGIEVKDGIGSTRTELGEQKNLKNGDYIKKYIDEGTIPTNVESNESGKKQIEIINAADQSGLQKLSNRVNEVYEGNCQEVKYRIEEKRL